MVAGDLLPILPSSCVGVLIGGRGRGNSGRRQAHANSGLQGAFIFSLDGAKAAFSFLQMKPGSPHSDTLSVTEQSDANAEGNSSSRQSLKNSSRNANGAEKFAFILVLVVATFVVGRFYSSGELDGLFVSNVTKPKSFELTAGDQIRCVKTTIGDKTCAADFKNDSGQALDEVNVVFTFKTEHATEVVIKRYWARWEAYETKSISLPQSIFIEKFSLSGSCTQCRIEISWLDSNFEKRDGFDSKWQLPPEEQGRVTARIASSGATWASLASLITRQKDRVKEFESKLTTQYRTLDAKRVTLKEKSVIDAFNADAAEYGKQVQQLRNEEAFLKGLTEKAVSPF